METRVSGSKGTLQVVATVGYLLMKVVGQVTALRSPEVVLIVTVLGFSLIVPRRGTKRQFMAVFAPYITRKTLLSRPRRCHCT